MKLKKLICIGLLGVLCAVSAVGCGKKESIKTTTEVSSEANTKEASAQVFAMDTYMNLKAYGKNAQKAVDDAKSEIERLDQLWSAVDKNSRNPRRYQAWIHALDSGNAQTEAGT